MITNSGYYKALLKLKIIKIEDGFNFYQNRRIEHDPS